jgi:DNA polymerase-4
VRLDAERLQVGHAGGTLVERHGPCNNVGVAHARVILHADMDAFYASVEQRDRPELRGRPVIVGGTSTRGVVMAASYEARPFGVHSAMPTVEARRLCPEAVFLHGDMGKYRAVGVQIRALFHEFTPLVEPLSLDEAFLDVTGCERRLGTPQAIARRLKERVRAETSLVVSVGAGPTKMIAKIASDLSKPDGLLEVPAAQVDAFLRPLPVSRLWGVGPRTRSILAGAGIVTVGDLAGCPAVRLQALLGRGAEHLHRLARGADVREVDPDRDAKSYGEENTFGHDVGHDVRHDAAVRDAIIAHAEAVARRLRRDGVRGGTVVLKVKLARRLGGGRFRVFSRQVALPEPTDDGDEVARAALALWTRHRPAEPIRLVGVSATAITTVTETQLGLFVHPSRTRRAHLNAALDAIAERFGEDSVRRGRAAAPKLTGSGQWKRGESE